MKALSRTTLVARGQMMPVRPDFATWEDLRPAVTEEILKEIARRIADAFDPERIILFGSYVWGSPGKYSDLDLFVVMDSEERRAQRGAKVHKVAAMPFIPMDVLVYTPDELKQRTKIGDPFVGEILAKGRVLYKREHR